MKRGNSTQGPLTDGSDEYVQQSQTKRAKTKAKSRKGKGKQRGQQQDESFDQNEINIDIDAEVRNFKGMLDNLQKKSPTSDLRPDKQAVG